MKPAPPDGLGGMAHPTYCSCVATIGADAVPKLHSSASSNDMPSEPTPAAPAIDSTTVRDSPSLAPYLLPPAPNGEIARVVVRGSTAKRSSPTVKRPPMPATVFSSTATTPGYVAGSTQSMRAPSEEAACAIGPKLPNLHKATELSSAVLL